MRETNPGGVWMSSALMPEIYSICEWNEWEDDKTAGKKADA